MFHRRLASAFQPGEGGKTGRKRSLAHARSEAIFRPSARLAFWPRLRFDREPTTVRAELFPRPCLWPPQLHGQSIHRYPCQWIGNDCAARMATGRENDKRIRGRFHYNAGNKSDQQEMRECPTALPAAPNWNRPSAFPTPSTWRPCTASPARTTAATISSGRGGRRRNRRGHSRHRSGGGHASGVTSRRCSRRTPSCHTDLGRCGSRRPSISWRTGPRRRRMAWWDEPSPLMPASGR